jgi:hypothetical protein
VTVRLLDNPTIILPADTTPTADDFLSNAPRAMAVVFKLDGHPDGPGVKLRIEFPLGEDIDDDEIKRMLPTLKRIAENEAQHRVDLLNQAGK